MATEKNAKNNPFIVTFTSVRSLPFCQLFSFGGMSLFPVVQKCLTKSRHSTTLSLKLKEALSNDLKVWRTVVISVMHLTRLKDCHFRCAYPSGSFSTPKFI